jgi:hypothetical protein
MTNPDIPDWAARAGVAIAESGRLSAHRAAEIITHYAEPLIVLLRQAKRSHSFVCESRKLEDNWGCSCGANEWNSRVEELLKSD